MTALATAMLCPVRARLRTLVPLVAVAAATCGITLLTASPALARRRGCADAHARVAHTPRRQLQRAVACLLNAERRAHGLPALRQSSRLNRSAQGWTDTMVGVRAFGHGADFAARISAVGFRWSSVGENIATGFSTPAAVVRAWMASTGHCQNILNPTFRDVGTGVLAHNIAGYSSSAGTWTNDFALAMGSSPASGNWGPARGCPYQS